MRVHEGGTTYDGNSKVQETVEDGSGGKRDEMNLYLESAYLVNTLKKLAVKLNDLENKPERGNRLRDKQTKVKKEIEEILDKRTYSLGVDFKDHNFRTLLHWGCILGNDYMVSLFLEKGADPNCQDKWWNTPLHYATYFCPGVVLKLLEKGAKIWIHNEKYESPLQRISPDTLWEYLDGCMHENGRGYDYKAQLDLTFLMPPKESKESKDVEKSKFEESMFAETTCLWWITKSPQHHVVLKHPVITAFLDLKWQQISTIYKLLCIVYLLYLVLLYFFLNAGAFHSMQEARKSMTNLGNERRLGADCTVYQSLQDLESAASSVKDNFTQRLSQDEKAYFQCMAKGWTVVRFVLVGFNSLILLLEFLQLLLNPLRYLLSVMNLLKMAMVASIRHGLGLLERRPHPLLGETQDIKEKAEALRHVSQVKLIFYVESIFLQDPEYIFHVFNIWTRVKKWFGGSTPTRRSSVRYPSFLNCCPCFNPILKRLAMKLMLLQADGWHPTLTVHPMMDIVNDLDIPGQTSSSVQPIWEQTWRSLRSREIRMDIDAPSARNASRASGMSLLSKKPSPKALSLGYQEAENLIHFMKTQRNVKANQPVWTASASGRGKSSRNGGTTKGSSSL
ncbi:unnamed protein product [Darwinula stevensoni]|uniref:Uncharacterized protein n=1 Tax=Darwinula stevensoni TaxID=69355 RepID=A0A7R9AAN9_9CRUS|nr:unnamed protein product [Darwinula stevensoni]CAG0898608.1 unnamed protein product [Darwinula stevensoni]